MDEDSNSNLTFEEKIAALEEELPEPILDFLHSPERDATSLRLSQKYRLHADQAAAFERAYLYMLLGVNSPHDFVQDLKDADIDLESIKGLTNDINEQVFKKIQKQELSSIPERTAPPAKPLVPVPSIAAASEKPAAQVTPAASEAPPFNLVKPTALPVVSAAVRPSVPPATPAPVMRTMQHDMELVQHGSQPSAYPAPSLHPAQATPARMFQTASVPVTAAPLPAQSAPEMIHLVPDAPAPVSAALPSAKSPLSVPQAAPVKEYSSDPYREAI